MADIPIIKQPISIMSYFIGFDLDKVALCTAKMPIIAMATMVPMSM